MGPTIDTLRKLAASLDQAAREIHRRTSQGKIPPEEATAVGSILTDLVKRANKALEPLKEGLREDALDRSKGHPGPVYFNAPDGSQCIVVIPKQMPAIRPDANVEQIKTALGDRFGQYFTEKVVFGVRKDFSTSTATPDEIKLVLQAIDINDGTPRVSFRD